MAGNAARNAQAEIGEAILASGPILHYARRAGRSRRLVYLSPNAGRLVGAAPEAILASPEGWGGQVHPDDVERYRQAEAALVRAAEIEVAYRLRAADGDRWVRDSLRRSGGLILGSVVDISREKTAQDAHQGTTDLMRTMVRSALDAVVAIDEDGRIIEFNPAAEAMFGHARAEAIGRSFSQLITPPELRAAHDAGIARMRDRGAAEMPDRRVQAEALRKDGSRFPVEVTVARATSGGKSVFVGEIRDISERVDALAERDRITALLRDAVENLPVAFSVTDHDDRIILCNEVFARFYGHSAASMRGRRRLELVGAFLQHLRAVDGQPFSGTASEAERLRARLRNPNGEPMEIELADGSTVLVWSKRLSGGGIVCVRTDVTAIKRAEGAVRESTEIIRRVVDSCPVPLAMTTAAENVLLYESAASMALFGRTPDQTPRTCREAFADPSARDRLVEALSVTGRLDGFEVELRRYDGSTFWAAMSARLIDFHGEQVIVSSIFDLTERRAVEAQLAHQREALHQNEKLAALGELLAGVAHELNNPLSVIIGQALLLQETSSDLTATGRLMKINRAADRCVRIVRTFLSMARQQPRRSERLDLNALVRQTLEVAEHGLHSSGVELVLRLASALPPIEGDGDQLIQAMANLVFNAENALRDVAGPRRLEVETRVEGRLVQVVVRDNGPGIPADLQRRVFEPFFTTKEVGSGTGIGLSYCHRVIEAHDGRIRLESAPGRGATFTIALPCADPLAPHTPPVVAELSTSGHRVLVIDDEVDVADIIATILRSQGHAVDIAHSGREALHRLDAVVYDVILSDLRMPGLDGERLFEHLLRERPGLVDRVAFVTGDAMGRRAQSFLRRSGRPVLEKPIRPADAARLIATIVDGPASAPSPALALLA